MAGVGKHILAGPGLDPVRNVQTFSRASEHCGSTLIRLTHEGGCQSNQRVARHSSITEYTDRNDRAADKAVIFLYVPRKEGCLGPHLHGEFVEIGARSGDILEVDVGLQHSTPNGVSPPA